MFMQAGSASVLATEQLLLDRLPMVLASAL
jgi:hypothetical protein